MSFWSRKARSPTASRPCRRAPVPGRFYPADGPPPALDVAFLREHASGSLSINGVAQGIEEIVRPVPFTGAGARLDGSTARRLDGVTNSKKPTPTSVWGLWKHVPALPAGEPTLWAVGTIGTEFTVDVTYRLLVSCSPAVSYPVA